MSSRESWKTWAAVAVLLIFAGLASAVVPFLLDQVGDGTSSAAEATRDPLETAIDVSQLPFIGEVLVEIPFIADNIQGQPIKAWQAFGIAFGAVLVGVGALGLLITVVTLLFDRLVNRTYDDEAYQEATAALQEKEKARLKDIQQGHPSKAGPEKATRSRRSMVVFAFIFLLLVWIIAYTLGTVYFGDTEVAFVNWTIGAASLFTLVISLVTIVLLYLILRRRDPEEFESPASDNKPVNWGYVWIVVSGLLIVGIGAGAALATRGG